MAFRPKRLVQMSTTFLHPVTSTASTASEVEHKEPGGKSLSQPVTPNCTRPSFMIPGLKAHGRTSFHGFTTYWMIKKAPSCTVYCVENTGSRKNDGVGQCTMPTVSPS